VFRRGKLIISLKPNGRDTGAGQGAFLSFSSLYAWSLYSSRPRFPVKGALCAEVKRLRVSYNQNDETLSRNSLRYLSKANLTIAVN